MIVRELFVRLGVKNDRGSFQRANQSISRLRNALLSVAAGAGLAFAGKADAATGIHACGNFDL